MEGIRFFGAIDRKGKHQKGGIASNMPGYFNTIQVENLREEYESEERRIEQGQVPAGDVPFVKERIQITKKRYESIVSSRPKVSGKQKDDVAKYVEKIGNEIKNSMFTRDEMEMGTANAHVEVSRMLDPMFEVDPAVARECGVKLVDGKTGRNGLVKIWQLHRHILGEHSNAEILRRR